jgi:hypothetical protein
VREIDDKCAGAIFVTADAPSSLPPGRYPGKQPAADWHAVPWRRRALRPGCICVGLLNSVTFTKRWKLVLRALTQQIVMASLRGSLVVGSVAVAGMLSVVGCGRVPLDPSADLAVDSGGAGGNGPRPTGRGEVGGGSGRGGAASGGASGSGGAPTSSTPIPCGATSCTAGTQTCCIQRMNGRPRGTCIPSTAVCSSGFSVSCIDSSACGAGQVCCEDVLQTSTACSDPETCIRAPGVILCSANGDCPAFAAHCCQTEAGGICAAQTCPAGGG